MTNFRTLPVSQYNQIIKFYNVEKICAAELEEIKRLFVNHSLLKGLTIGIMFRLLITKIFSEDIEKVIYIDSDTIVNLDISEFWKIPLEDKPIAAVPELANQSPVTANLSLCTDGHVDAEDYFNSGVLFINLEKWRGDEYETLQEGMKFIAENPKYPWIDQEIFNYCFSKVYLKLPSKFNFFVRESIWRNEFKTENRILHYLSGRVNLNMHNAFSKLWFKYFQKTA